MGLRNSYDRYGSLSIGLHWLMVLVLIAVYATISLTEVAPRGSDLRSGLEVWHYAFGLCILALLAARVGLYTVAGPKPRIVPPISRWQALSARAMHLALYAFMLFTPLLGWVAISARGAPIQILGLPLPMPVGPDRGLSEVLNDIHELFGSAGYYLLGLHAAAALIHHYVIRDTTLLRMLPARAAGTGKGGPGR